MDSNFTNHFLISTAKNEEDMFASAMVYVCRHDEDGAFGVIVNKPSDTKVSDLFDSLKIASRPAADYGFVLNGGPVKPEQVIILHSLPGEYDMTIKINDQIGVTLSRDILGSISDKRGPEKCIFVFGYAGWGAGQLEVEIKHNDWIAIPANVDIIFDTPINTRLPEATRRFGFDINHLSDVTGHA